MLKTSWTGGRELSQSETYLYTGERVKSRGTRYVRARHRMFLYGESQNISLTNKPSRCAQCCSAVAGRQEDVTLTSSEAVRCSTARHPPSSVLVHNRIKKWVVRIYCSMSHWEGKAMFLDVFRSQRSVAKDDKDDFHASEHKSTMSCFALTIP